MTVSRTYRRLTTALIFLVLASGCGLHKAAPAPAPDQAASAEDNGANQPSAPEAKIHISYTHPDDYLQSMTVTKYQGAQMLRSGGADQNASSTVRFQGGIVVWEFKLGKGFFGRLPGLNERAQYAPNQVKYGALPSRFVQSLPDNGPPEPLEADHFYVFQVVRASGSTSSEAVKVNDDGSLEAYAADPRAGDSYELCCSIAQDFIFVPLPAEAPPSPPPDAR